MNIDFINKKKQEFLDKYTYEDHELGTQPIIEGMDGTDLYGIWDFIEQTIKEAQEDLITEVITKDAIMKFARWYGHKNEIRPGKDDMEIEMCIEAEKYIKEQSNE